MARTKSQGNGKLDKLDEAMSALVQAQALLVQNQAAFQSELTQVQRVNAERFERLERILLEHSRILAEHSRILAEHSRILQALPDAVRDRIGFKVP